MYEEIDRVVYAATLRDSNDYYCPEWITYMDSLVRFSKNKIEIVKELHREKAVAVLKNHKVQKKKGILITGSILNTDDSSQDIYKSLQEIVESYPYKENQPEVYSPLDTMKFEGSAKERYERAMDLLWKSQMVIAEMTHVSTGQGMELQEAIRLNLPILVVAKKGSKISGLVKGAPNVKKIIYYDTIYDIQMEILNFIEEVIS